MRGQGAGREDDDEGCNVGFNNYYNQDYHEGEAGKIQYAVSHKE